MSNLSSTQVISIPVSLLEKMSEAARAFEEAQDELEDYLLAHDEDFLARMRQARARQLRGEARPLDDLKRELCIE